MKKLTKTDLYDILYGCTILGTGGGGELQRGLEMIDEALEAGKDFVLVDLDELEEDAYIGTPYMCGSVSPKDEKDVINLPQIEKAPAVKAFQVMEKYFGKSFTGVIATELGGSNTAVAFYVAAMMGKYIIDGDPAGRSVPELQHSTYFLKDLPIAPITVANEFGDVAIIENAVDDFRAEALVRSMAIVSNNSVAVVDHPATKKQLEDAIIKGSVSYALKLGRAFRLAKENNEDPAKAVVEAGEGKILFKGAVADYNWETANGFTFGNTLIEGKEGYEGSIYKIWYKNENIISWKDNVIHATVPDLISIIRDDTGEPVTNPYFEVGMPVTVIALPSPAEWTTERGLEVFGPKHFGYDIEFKSIIKENECETA
ncbi:DUF917 domain-containing protein [Natronincola ferrireducens]|uniref:DUF917 domain-containing protein n=1 Tax=Natronincola ferrireducens TaxID=393762 RepID=A0A1G9F5N9_9FIRM|nr:DUF917 domain-containing protein [Natronincola ferrireducens]SDK83694.1 hypothetical protein SAMN05660472_02093 [Natronincola ferrireducens]